jgi:predicted enzyme related to lactoylglutathione lyase
MGTVTGEWWSWTKLSSMAADPLLLKVDAVTVPVPDLVSGLRFYRDHLGHTLLWRDDAIGQAGLGLPEGSTEIVLSTQHAYEPDWLVTSVDEAVDVIESGGGRVIAPPSDIPVGRIAVVADPFDNVLVVLDLSRGRYTTDDSGSVTGVSRTRTP